MTRSRVVSIFVVLVALSLAGCAHALAGYSSGQVGCSPDEITISDDRPGWGSRTWTAECRGRRYFCSGSEQDVSCRPEAEGEPTHAGAASPTAPTTPTPAAGAPTPAPEPSRVRRWVRDGQALFVAETSSRLATIKWMTSPATDPEGARLVVPSSAGASSAACPAGLLIDGLVEPLTVHRTTAEEITYSTSLDLVRRAAAAQHLSGRVCAEELVFDADDVATLRELVRRTDEELAWTRAQSVPSSAPPATRVEPAPAR